MRPRRFSGVHGGGKHLESSSLLAVIFAKHMFAILSYIDVGGSDSDAGTRLGHPNAYYRARFEIGIQGKA